MFAARRGAYVGFAAARGFSDLAAARGSLSFSSRAAGVFAATAGAAYLASTSRKFQGARCDVDTTTLVGTAVASAAGGFAAGRYLSTQAHQGGPVKDILVVCGPSGVGKGTLIKLLFEEFGKSQVGFSVSHTTRNARPGEENGVHYHFVEKEKVRAEIAAGMFVESAEVHGNIYGTSIKAIKDVTAQGKVCVLDIDVQGAEQVKKSDLDSRAVYIFISPPSMAELEARLRGRATETEEKIQLRLKTAQTEMKYTEMKGFWTKVLPNDNLKTASANFNETVRQLTRVQ